MTRLLTTMAISGTISALVLGAGASAWAQSVPGRQPMTLGTYDARSSEGYGAWPTDHNADALNRGIAERNAAATQDDQAARESYAAAMAHYNAAINAYSYGASGLTPPTMTTTTTTTTTTFPPPSYPGGSR